MFPSVISHASVVAHIFSSRLSQASNGNDPWSVWNADPSGGSNNNWASNPEGTQTGKSAADPWGPISQGHPQAYQGPGKKKLTGHQPWLMLETVYVSLILVVVLALLSAAIQISV